jgi:hypothetical protein
MNPTRSRSIACVADRLGRNPYETGKKSASKIGSSTSFTAAWATRSRTVGIPNGRLPPPGFGMSTRLAGAGRYDPLRRSCCRSPNIRATPYSSTCASVTLSTPAAPLLARTRSHAATRTSPRWTRSNKAWKRRPGDCLAAAHSARCSSPALPTRGTTNTRPATTEPSAASGSGAGSPTGTTAAAGLDCLPELLDRDTPVRP